MSCAQSTYRSHLVFLLALTLASQLVGGVAWSMPQLQWRPAKELAEGRGIKGPWQQNDSKYDYVDDATVAINDKKEIAIAWVDQSKKDIFHRHLSPDGPKRVHQPVNVSRSPKTFSWLPRVFFAPDNRNKVYIIWEEIIFSGGSHGGDILFARSDDQGQTFTEPLNISSSIGGDGKGRINKEIWSNGSLDLAVGPEDQLLAAWTEYHGQLWVSRSKDGGKSFSKPKHVAGGANSKPARGPSVARGADETFYLAWTTGEDDASDIMIQVSRDGGATFGAPKAIAKSKSYSDAPKVAVDSKGKLHLVYAESSGDPFATYRIRYTQSSDGARTFTKPKEISSPVPVPVKSSRYPQLAIDGKDGLYVAWELYPDPKGDPRGLGLSVSNDGGRSFTAPSLIPESIDPSGGTNGSHQGLLAKKLDVNETGQVVIANSSLKQNEHSRVWLMIGQLETKANKAR